MTTTTTRANRGEQTNPRDVIACSACGLKLGANAIHNIVGGPIPRVVCTRCIHRIRLHAHYYPSCPWEHHDLLDHHFESCTRAAARQIIRERTTR